MRSWIDSKKIIYYKIACKQKFLITDFNLLKSLQVVFRFGSQAFICGFNRQNICSVNKDNQMVSTIKPVESDNNYKDQTVPGKKPSQEW